MACPATRVLLLLLAWPALQAGGVQAGLSQVLAGKENIKPTLTTGAPPSSTEVPLVLVAVSQSSSTSVSRGPTSAPAVQVVLPGSTPAAVVTPSTPELSSRHEELDLEEVNNTREALSSQGSEQNSVVFVADGAGYVPVTQLRSRVPANFGRPQLQPQQEVSTVALSEDASEWSQNWDRGYNHYRHNYSRVQHIEAECQDDFMKIRVGFNGSFSGVLYSSGYSYDPECVYVNGTGRDYYEFYIQMNRCGTLGKNTANELSRKQPSKNFMWNTVTVQYNPMIEEEWDEHFKVTCEYGYDFWKTVTFPFLDVEVATGNPLVFTLSPPECYMEVRHGYGITGTRVSGPVRVGDPLTLLIYMRSKYDGFDIVVNDCYAHNGANKRIQLIDQYGCPVDEKLISRFRGSWSETGIYETQVFAYMKTFRFTGSPALYVECDVRMCHGKCPNQPCHWRNAKSVRRRSVANDLLSTLAPQTVALSENISLFQSLRVLQEGEHSDEDDSTLRAHRLGNGGGEADSICVKSGAFTALFGLGCVLTAGLGLAVTLLCFRVRALGKGAPLELTDTEARTNRELLAASSTSSLHTVDFLTHKGRIH